MKNLMNVYEFLATKKYRVEFSGVFQIQNVSGMHRVKGIILFKIYHRFNRCYSGI